MDLEGKVRSVIEEQIVPRLQQQELCELYGVCFEIHHVC